MNRCCVRFYIEHEEPEIFVFLSVPDYPYTDLSVTQVWKGVSECGL